MHSGELVNGGWWMVVVWMVDVGCVWWTEVKGGESQGPLQLGPDVLAGRGWWVQDAIARDAANSQAVEWSVRAAT